MAARGYDGEVRSLSHPALTRASLVVLIAGLAVLALLLAFSRLAI
jgi:hypothetical protein